MAPGRAGSLGCKACPSTSTCPCSAGGEPHTREEWEKAAADVLRKTGRMTSGTTPTRWSGRSSPGPRSTASRSPPLGTPGAGRRRAGGRRARVGAVHPGPAPDAPRRAGTSAPTSPTPTRERGAEDALTDLENGVTSLWLPVGAGGIAAADLPTVLREGATSTSPRSSSTRRATRSAPPAPSSTPRRAGVDPAPGTSLGGDPSASRSATARTRGAPAPGDVDDRRGWPSSPASAAPYALDRRRHRGPRPGGHRRPGARLLPGRRGGVPAAARPTAGLDVATAALRLLEFRYAATDEQFLTIAKLRAARRLWHRVLELSGAPGRRPARCSTPSPAGRC